MLSNNLFDICDCNSRVVMSTGFYPKAVAIMRHNGEKASIHFNNVSVLSSCFNSQESELQYETYQQILTILKSHTTAVNGLCSYLEQVQSRLVSNGHMLGKCSFELVYSTEDKNELPSLSHINIYTACSFHEEEKLSMVYYPGSRTGQVTRGMDMLDLECKSMPKVNYRWHKKQLSRWGEDNV